MSPIRVFVFALIPVCCCLPPHVRRPSKFDHSNTIESEGKNSANESSPLDQLGIEYTRYLQQVVDTLENDEAFKKKLESAQESDIRSAKIAEELEYVNHHVRSKLDELKRTELQRLRELAKQAYGNQHDLHLDPPGHLDHENPNTFEIKDLKKLIHKVAEDLEEADKKRKEMFKNYEMQKHFEREEKLKYMTDEEKRKFLLQEEEMKKQEQEAKKRVHHPGSKQQLEEVWEEQDHMNKNDFNPKTFFVMHDVDGNGFLDEDEVKTLFLKELDKLYSQGMPQADLIERAEEMERMREHVFSEVDKNRDRLISWDEFYAMSLKPEFNEDSGWQPIDDQQIYSPEELRAYEQQRQHEIEQMMKEGKNASYYHYDVGHSAPYVPPHAGAYSPYQQPGMRQQIPPNVPHQQMPNVPHQQMPPNVPHQQLPANVPHQQIPVFHQQAVPVPQQQQHAGLHQQQLPPSHSVPPHVQGVEQSAHFDQMALQSHQDPQLQKHVANQQQLHINSQQPQQQHISYHQPAAPVPNYQSNSNVQSHYGVGANDNNHPAGVAVDQHLAKGDKLGAGVHPEGVVRPL